MGQSPAGATFKNRVGDSAPAIQGVTWLKGKPVSTFEPGKVYVVEFWATWCYYCKLSMPHLSQLAKEYGDKVTVIGVSVKENFDGNNPDYADRVAAFVKGSKAMDYRVAMDGKESIMAENWMHVYGSPNAMPTAYIITKDGKIGWAGHPLADMKAALDLAIAGKLDSKTAVEMTNAESRNAHVWSDLYTKVYNAMRKKDFDTARAKLDEADKIKPSYSIVSTSSRYELLAMTDPTAAHEFAERFYEAEKDNDIALRMIPAVILNETNDLKTRDYPIALKMLQRAAQLSPERTYAYQSDLAMAYAKTGDFSKAAKIQQSAVELAKEDSRDEARKKLEEYKTRMTG